MIGWLLSAVLAQSDWLNLNNGELVFHQIITHSFTLDQDKLSMTFQVTGNPAQIVDRPNGETMQGDAMSGELLKVSDGGYLLNKADATGHAKLSLSSALPDLTSLSVLESEELSLRTDGKSKSQTLTIPRSLKLTDSREFKGSKQTDATDATKSKVLNPYEQTTTITGSSAVINYLVKLPESPTSGTEKPAAQNDHVYRPRGMRDLQTGKVEGPVHYHSVRTEHPPKAAVPTITEYDLTADRLILDFTGPTGTITALGHVKWRETGELNISGNESQAVLTIDKDGRVQKLTGDGAPTTTVIPLPAPGGGQR
jgi:hypothetical protein